MKLPLPKFLTEPTDAPDVAPSVWFDVFILLAVLTVGFLWRSV